MADTIWTAVATRCELLDKLDMTRPLPPVDPAVAAELRERMKREIEIAQRPFRMAQRRRRAR